MRLPWLAGEGREGAAVDGRDTRGRDGGEALPSHSGLDAADSRDTPRRAGLADSLKTGNLTGNFQFFVSFGRGVRRAGVPACSLGPAGSANSFGPANAASSPPGFCRG